MSLALSSKLEEPRRLRLHVAAAMVAAASLCLAAPLPARAEAAAASARNIVAVPSFAPLVKKVLPAVVNISASEKIASADDQGDDQGQGDGQDQLGPGGQFPPSPFDQFLRRFFGQQGSHGMQPFGQSGPVQQTALGSGFIIDPSGYIVTNNHVINNADKVTVIFQDGSKHPAKIIGRDKKTDLALLKIDAPKPLPYVSWGDSDAMNVGDWVLAVGNPFGLGGSISPGTIAARGRDIGSGPYDDFLQIDASINRGNSGGPSFNLAGQVIGINTAIYSPNGGSVGIGFAIPSNEAKPVIEQLREHGKVERGWLGVEVQQVTPALAKSLGLPKDEGALISQVTPDGPAAKAGFKQGDVILSFNGHDIPRMHDLPFAVATTPAGKSVDVKVWRNRANLTLKPVIAPMPANLQVAENGGGSDTAAGLHLSALTAEWRHRLDIPSSVHGVVVTSISNDSPLADLGLQAGDVIESINQKPVRTPAEAVAAIDEARKQSGPNREILMLLNRHGTNEFVAMSIGTGNGTG